MGGFFDFYIDIFVKHCYNVFVHNMQNNLAK